MPVTSRPSTASISGAWKTAPARPKPTMPTRTSAMQQRLQHARLAERFLAPEPRRAAIGDRRLDVVELAPVRVGLLDVDALAVDLDHRVAAVPRVAQHDAPAVADRLQARQLGVERALQARGDAARKAERRREVRVDAVARRGRLAVDRVGLGAGEQPRGADAVAADVHERPAPELRVPARVLVAVEHE